jgi:hypothetical protein|tara:strand:+ start:374 stop:886 length:513 start_codon:yes stop_codon:yes gene_type:complete
MTDNTTRVIKLANGESIVCTCIPTRTDEGSQTLHIIHPLKMELKNRITKKGIVEALTLSRWLQPFTESDEFDIEKTSIITNTEASFALNNYYQMMLNSYSEADAVTNVQPTPEALERVEEYEQEQEEPSSEEVRKLFNEYVERVRQVERDNKDVISEEELDSLPISETKH